MSPDNVPADVVLPCGCDLTFSITGQGERELRYAACRAGCPNLVAAMQLARSGRVPVVRRTGS